MRLDQALVIKGLCKTRTEAQELITSSGVLVNGVISTKQTSQVNDTTKIELIKKRNFVSRGGDKLEGALMYIYTTPDAIHLELLEKHALDVGSSTGGFTDCLLKYGVSHVTAVDVGTGQLHEDLLTNPMVTSHESTDIRNFPTDTLFDIIVADLSFISLDKMLPKLYELGSPHSSYFLLLKPQFEVGKGNTKKGIVKDKELLDDLVIKYTKSMQEHLFAGIKVFMCSVLGKQGNQEYFIYAKKS